jgi:DsbC/DsbD-like thiol-disulfide interchange protein
LRLLTYALGDFEPIRGRLERMLSLARRASIALGLLLWLLAGGAAAQGQAAHHVKASLLAETDAVSPGRPLQLGIRLEMEKEWHTYWENPGDSGLATRVKWELPTGFSAGEVRWPYPVRFATGPVVSYGYEGDVLLPVAIEVPPKLATSEVRISARVSWLECREACLPGKAELVLTLPVQPSARAADAAALFAQARTRLPVQDPSWRVSAEGMPRSILLAVRPPHGTSVRDAYFYPVTPRLVDYSRPQGLGREGGAIRLELARDPNGVPAERLNGVLVADTAAGRTALQVDVKLGSGPVRTRIEKEGKP